MRRDLPHVVALFAAALRVRARAGRGARPVVPALPGPAADRLAGVAARLALGLDPARSGRPSRTTRARPPRSHPGPGAHAPARPVVAAVERLADELARAGRADVEERARAVGVKAAVPLGLCLLPAFVLIGIVPLVAGLLDRARLW